MRGSGENIRKLQVRDAGKVHKPVIAGVPLLLSVEVL